MIYDSQANIFNRYMILKQIFLIYDSQANSNICYSSKYFEYKYVSQANIS